MVILQVGTEERNSDVSKVSNSFNERKPWIRLYRASLNNPKIGKLTDRQHRVWHNCLLIASDNGELPSMGDIAFHLRMSCEDVERIVTDLIDVGLIDVELTKGPRRLIMHDWDTHQYVSDTSTERVRKFREKSKTKQNETDVKRFISVSETPPDTDTDTDTDEVLLDEGGKNFEFEKKGWAKSVTVDRLKDRALGLGLDVDDIVQTVNERKPKNREAYFTKMCVIRLQDMLPDVPESVLRDAIWNRKSTDSFVLVTQALLESAQ